MIGYFFNLYGVSPDGPSRVPEGEEYGGETMLFVVADVGFANALKCLIEATRSNELEIIRMVSAGRASAFDPEDFPFPHDLDAMVKDATAMGEICVTDGRTFAPIDKSLSGVTLGFADVFDPKRVDSGRPYAGEIVPFALKGGAHLALEGLVLRCEAENLTLKGMHSVADATFSHPDVLREILSIRANQGVLSRGKLCWGASYAYEYEEDT